MGSCVGKDGVKEVELFPVNQFDIEFIKGDNMKCRGVNGCTDHDTYFKNAIEKTNSPDDSQFGDLVIKSLNLETPECVEISCGIKEGMKDILLTNYLSKKDGTLIDIASAIKNGLPDVVKICPSATIRNYNKTVAANEQTAWWYNFSNTCSNNPDGGCGTGTDTCSGGTELYMQVQINPTTRPDGKFPVAYFRLKGKNVSRIRFMASQSKNGDHIFHANPYSGPKL